MCHVTRTPTNTRIAHVIATTAVHTTSAAPQHTRTHTVAYVSNGRQKLIELCMGASEEAVVEQWHMIQPNERKPLHIRPGRLLRHRGWCHGRCGVGVHGTHTGPTATMHVIYRTRWSLMVALRRVGGLVSRGRGVASVRDRVTCHCTTWRRSVRRLLGSWRRSRCRRDGQIICGVAVGAGPIGLCPVVTTWVIRCTAVGAMVTWRWLVGSGASPGDTPHVSADKHGKCLNPCCNNRTWSVVTKSGERKRVFAPGFPSSALTPGKVQIRHAVTAFEYAGTIALPWRGGIAQICRALVQRRLLRATQCSTARP